MAKKISSLIGMPINDFLNIIDEKKQLSVRSARLIPIYKLGDEMALTSIFLSALRLVKEFRKEVLSEVNLSMAGTVYVFTEVCFRELKKDQPDGLIIVVSGGKIKDAALLEVKNKNAQLKEDQIQSYLEIAKQYKIKKFITISNQFVSTPTQSPLQIKPPKSISLYHLSWSYILTKAHILLFEKQANIADEDQVEIMREVAMYLEHDKSGVTGFTVMKRGWKVVTDKIRSGSALNKDEGEVIDTVSGWLQEERDMALRLSRELGLLVKSGINKYKHDLQGRIDYEIKNLLDKKALSSTLQVRGAASDIAVSVYFDRRLIQMEVSLNPPEDKTNRGKIGWIRNQINTAQKKSADKFKNIAEELALYVYVKRQREPVKIQLDELDNAWEKFKDKEIKRFGIRQEKSLGRRFEAVQKIVGEIEDMLLDYYSGIVMHLKAWVAPAPKPQQKASVSNLDNY